jgi:predicted transcriptional regulator
MILRRNKITLYRSRRPNEDNINDELQWFCDSLGLFGERDRDKSCFRMFVVLLRSLRDADGMSSDEISEKVDLSRGTVVHHLHKLISAGLVVPDRNKYMLRVERLSTLIDEIEQDMLRTTNELRKVAQDIDKKLEL